MKILVSRNDKLGDFMLIWPALAMLRKSMPEAHITVLVSAYTQEVARQCPWVDQVLVDTGDAKTLVPLLKQEQFDTAIALFSNWHIASSLFKARIPYRLGPATKWAQVCYNRRLLQRRSKSVKPEHAYNCDLIERFLKHQNVDVVRGQAPDWAVEQSERESVRSQLVGEGQHLFFLHPSDGGSASNLTIEQYAQYVNYLHQELDGLAFKLVVTHGPGEKDKAEALVALFEGGNIDAVVAPVHKNIVDFALMLSGGHLMIAGSTGPLHLAASMDVPTAGFYPSCRSASSLRWQTTNSPERRVAFSSCDENLGPQEQMDDICLLEASKGTADMLREIWTTVP